MLLLSACVGGYFVEKPERRYAPLLERLHEVACTDRSQLDFSERRRLQDEAMAVRGKLSALSVEMLMSPVDRREFTTRYQETLECSQRGNER